MLEYLNFYLLCAIFATIFYLYAQVKRYLPLLKMAEELIGNYYLLTGCKGCTRKYKPKIFHTARACEGCLENQGLVFPGTAQAPS